MFHHLEEKEGRFHIDFKYFVPSLANKTLFPKILPQNFFMDCWCYNLFRAAKDGSKVRVDSCIWHQYVETSPPLTWYVQASEATALQWSNVHLLTVDSNKALLSDDFPTWQTWIEQMFSSQLVTYGCNDDICYGHHDDDFELDDIFCCYDEL